MREIRLSGSEGGEAETTGLPYPYHVSDTRFRRPYTDRGKSFFKNLRSAV